jgi:hypothetical protein
MKQQLGLDYTKENPVSYIISQRFVDLVRVYGGISLLASLHRCNNKKAKLTSKRNHAHFIDIHVTNLIEAYGAKIVTETYELIYKPADMGKKSKGVA